MRNHKEALTKAQRVRIRHACGGMDRKLRREILTLYQTLLLHMGYEGHLNSPVAKTGLKRASEMIAMLKTMPHNKKNI